MRQLWRARDRLARDRPDKPKYARTGVQLAVYIYTVSRSHPHGMAAGFHDVAKHARGGGFAVGASNRCYGDLGEGARGK